MKRLDPIALPERRRWTHENGRVWIERGYDGEYRGVLTTPNDGGLESVRRLRDLCDAVLADEAPCA